MENELQLHGHAMESPGMHSVTEIDSCSKQRVKRRPAAPGLPDCGKSAANVILNLIEIGGQNLVDVQCLK